MVELNTIYNEDCLEGMKRIENKSVDMILCDLPYGTTKNKWDSHIDLDRLWCQYERIIKDNGVIALMAQPPFDSTLAQSNRKLFKYKWYWKKESGTGHLNAKHQPMKNIEEVLIFTKGATSYTKNKDRRATYFPQMRTGYSSYEIQKGGLSDNYDKDYVDSPIVTKSNGERYPLSLIEFPRDREKLHPTQKPVALFEYLINTYTNIGDTVLDNCIGSGTTAIAAINTGRDYVGFELDEEYCNIANDRIVRHGLSTVGKRCFRCGDQPYKSKTDNYESQCLTCDEDFYGFEQF